MRVKIARDIEREVIYNDEHWVILKEKRSKGVKILEKLAKYNIIGFLYGSVARGDVHKRSDIDIIILSPVKPFLIEHIIETELGGIYAREIVMATPKHAIKGHIYLDHRTTITIPLTSLSRNEVEFYRFGGMIGLPEAKDYKKRIKGVDKRLVMIIPKENGHKELSIIGQEQQVAKELGISIETVRERVRILTRRDEIGRTGVFVKKDLAPDESFDLELKKLVDKYPAIKRMLKKRNSVF